MVHFVTGARALNLARNWARIVAPEGIALAALARLGGRRNKQRQSKRPNAPFHFSPCFLVDPAQQGPVYTLSPQWTF